MKPHIYFKFHCWWCTTGKGGHWNGRTPYEAWVRWKQQRVIYDQAKKARSA